MAVFLTKSCHVCLVRVDFGGTMALEQMLKFERCMGKKRAVAMYTASSSTYFAMPPDLIPPVSQIRREIQCLS